MGYIKGVSKYCDNWRDALNELQVMIESLKAENSELKAKVPQWIPVSERLPENNTRVIVWMAWGGFSMLDYQYNYFYELNSVNNIPNEAVVAWMPLPKPYKGGEADG